MNMSCIVYRKGRNRKADCPDRVTSRAAHRIMNHMKTRHMLFCIMVLLAGMAASAVYATDRELEFSSEPSTLLAVSYQGEKIVITETLHIRHRGPITNAMMTFSAGQSADYDRREAVNTQGAVLSYQIYKDPATRHVLKDVDAKDSFVDDFMRHSLNYTFPTSVHEWQYYTFSYTIEIPAGQLHESGTYSDTFDMYLYERRNLNNLLQITMYDSRSVSINAGMSGLIQIAIVSPGSPPDFSSPGYTIDFGSIEPGMRKQADVVVVANTTYSIFVESPNQGVLKHDYPEIRAVIPYTMSFDGNPAAIQSPDQPVSVLTNGPPTGDQGVRYSLDVTISPFTPGPSGTYRDYPTFYIQAK